MIPPQTITILSDQNELQLTDTIKTKDGLRYVYVYKKSVTKKGMLLELTENDLIKLLKINT